MEDFPVSAHHLNTALSVSVLAMACASTRYDDAGLFMNVSWVNVYLLRHGKQVIDVLSALGLWYMPSALGPLTRLTTAAIEWLTPLDVTTPMIEVSGHPDGPREILLFGVAVSIVGAVFTMLLAKYSYALSLFGYVATITTLLQSRILQSYEARMLAFTVICVVSLKSRHIRMVNLGIVAILIERSLTADKASPLIDSALLVTSAWFSLLLCALYDILYIRTNLVRSLISTAHVVVVVISGLMAVELVGFGYQGHHLQRYRNPTWYQLLDCQHAAECVGNLKDVAPAIFSTFYSTVFFLRAIRSSENGTGVRFWTASGVVMAFTCYVLTVPGDTEPVSPDACQANGFNTALRKAVLQPQLYAVLATIAMLVTESMTRYRSGHSTEVAHGAPSAAAAVYPTANRSWHSLVYLSGSKPSRSNDSSVSKDFEDVDSSQVDPEQKGGKLQNTSSCNSMEDPNSFNEAHYKSQNSWNTERTTSPCAKPESFNENRGGHMEQDNHAEGIAIAELRCEGLPSETEMELRWNNVREKLESAEQAKKTYLLFKKLAFQQEAVVRGTIPYDQESQRRADTAKAQGEDLARKTRQAARVWSAKQDTAKKAETEARYWEAQLQKASENSSL